MLTKDKEDYLKSIYFNTSSSASFYGVDKLLDYIKKQNLLEITREEIAQWLSKQSVYTQNKQVICKFKRQKVIAPFINYQYDADIAYMDNFPIQNKGYKFFLLIIDLMSRFVWTIPLRTLKGTEVTQAFKKHFDHNNKPLKLRTDKGSEFINKQLKSFFKNQNIDHFVTQNEVKANYAERAIKTIRGRLNKFLKKNKSKVWINDLQKITDSYNATTHSSLGKAPKDITINDEHDIWERNYGPKDEDVHQAHMKSILNGKRKNTHLK